MSRNRNDDEATPKTSNTLEASPNEQYLSKLITQYGCGAVQFTGKDGLYERRLIFDNILHLSTAGSRLRFEALARSLRDVLSQRWLLTESTYEKENPKRIYYLS